MAKQSQIWFGALTDSDLKNSLDKLYKDLGSLKDEYKKWIYGESVC